MKRFLSMITLVCLLSAPAFAGDVPSVGITSPPPPPDEARAASTMAPGDVPSVGLSYEIADTAIDLIQMLIGVGI